MRRFGAALLAAALAGCTTSSAWGTDRLLDLSDIVDVRYGTGLGLGVQLDATMFFGTGLGGSGDGHTSAWFGRHRVDVDRADFFGMILASSMNGGMCGTSSARGWYQMLGFNVAMLGSSGGESDEHWFAGESDSVPVIDYFRVGGVLFLPGVHGGLHVNLGEVLDFVAGIFFLDPAHDDGVPKLPETAGQDAQEQDPG